MPWLSEVGEEAVVDDGPAAFKAYAREAAEHGRAVHVSHEDAPEAEAAPTAVQGGMSVGGEGGEEAVGSHLCSQSYHHRRTLPKIAQMTSLKTKTHH